MELDFVITIMFFIVQIYRNCLINLFRNVENIMELALKDNQHNRHIPFQVGLLRKPMCVPHK